MTTRDRVLGAALSLVIIVALAAPAAGSQIGVGLHYLRTLDDFGGLDEVSQNDFSLFGTITFPFVLLKVEGGVEWTPDYIGSDENLFQPTAYGLLDLGLFYGGAGIGIGYLTGDGNGWASNPFYALRAGVQLGLAGLALDAYLAFRFQSASFTDGVSNADLDALTLAAQIKFGG